MPVTITSTILVVKNQSADSLRTLTLEELRLTHLPPAVPQFQHKVWTALTGSKGL